MAGQLLDVLWVDGYGSAAGGGSVNFYQPGTLSLAIVYQDDALSQVVSQPVALDSSGRTVVPIYTNAPVRAIIQSSSGATLEDIARLNGGRVETAAASNAQWPGETTVDAVLTALGHSLGGLDGNFRNSGSGSVGRSLQGKLSEISSAKDFGALGNGVADDTVALNAALASLSSGGTLLIPSGTYNISSPLLVTTGNVIIRGVGAGASIIKNTASSTSAFSISNVSTVVFGDLGISALTSSTAAAIAQTGTSHWYERLSITGHRTGISGLAGKVIACDCTTDGNTASIAYSTVGDTLLLAATANVSLGTGIQFGAGTTNAVSISCTVTVVPGGKSISLPSSTVTGGLITGLTCIGGIASQVVLNGATGVKIFGNNLGNSAVQDLANSWVFSVAGGGSCTPDPSKWSTFKIKATSTGTVTVSYGGAAYREQPVTFICSNNTGGAVTFSFGGQFSTATGAISPTTGFSTVVVFQFDSDTNFYKEISRSTVGSV